VPSRFESFVITHQRRPDAKEDLECEWNLIAIISIELIRHIVNCDLPSQTDINASSVSQVANVSG